MGTRGGTTKASGSQNIITKGNIISLFAGGGLSA